MPRTKIIPSTEPVIMESNLNLPAPILLAAMMLMFFAMVASAASGFS